MLTHIFHISDIHIRNGDIRQCRYDEYTNVFKNLFESLKKNIKRLKLKKADFRIIVSGDIFHNKNNVGNYGLMLYKEFIEGLTKIGKTILFHGNHDKSQCDINQPSLISSTMHIDNLQILNETTCFKIDDVCFSYVSVDDTLDSYKTSGRIENLPEFPYIESEYKIAMFHGTFGNVSLYNGTNVSDEHKPYPFKWLQEFDFAILGDIHLRQYGEQGKTLWGYSGSLIQQNFGEDVINHGYMIWNIRKREIEEVNVYNETGMINIKQKDNQILMRNRGKYLDIMQYICHPNFPKILEIKLYSSVNIVQLMSLFEKYDIKIQIVSHIIEKQNNNQCKNDINDLSINQDTIIQYFKDHLSSEQHDILRKILNDYEQLYFNLSEYPEEIHDECLKKNREISQHILKCMDNDNIPPNQQFTIKYLEWKNIYCYENLNHIDFSKAYNNTFLISGDNGTGKSAIFDIITMGIWCETTSSRNGNISTNLINNKYKAGYIEIHLEIAEDEYIIRRNFNKTQTGFVKKVSIFLNNNILKKDNAANEIIKEIFGKMDEFLTSSMITQYVDNDMLKMNYKECLSVIDKSCKIDYIYNLYILLKNCLNKYKDLHKTLKNRRSVYEKIIIQDQTYDTEELLKTSEHLINQRKELEQEYDNIDLTTRYNKQEILSSNFEDILSKNKNQLNKTQYEELINQKKLFNDKLYQYSYEEIIEKSLQFKPNMELKNVEKPCDKKLIEDEEQFLKNYKRDIHYSTKEFEEIRNNKEKLDSSIQEILKIKPIVITKPQYTDKYIKEFVAQYYQYDVTEIETLKKYYDEYSKPCNIETEISLSAYTEYLQQHKKKQQEISDLNKNKKIEEDNLKTKYEILNGLLKSHFNKPDIPCRFKTSKGISKYISNINEEELFIHYRDLTKQLQIIKKQYDELIINKLEIQKLENELISYETDDEYQYDPLCQYCCKRSWVIRINEIKERIAVMKKNTDDNIIEQYNVISNEYDNIEKKVKEYQSLKDWFHYYRFDENLNQIQSDIENCKKKIEEIKTNEEKMVKDNEYICDICRQFESQSSNIYRIWHQLEDYKKYTEWNQYYEQKMSEKEKIDILFEKHYEYLQYEPRYLRLEELKKQYHIWEQNEIIFCHKYVIIKSQIDEYEEEQKCKECIMIKSAYDRKQHLSDMIKKLNEENEKCQKEIMKYETLNETNKQNTIEYQRYNECVEKIENIVEIIEIIISKFKLYRIDLYDNHILKKLMNNVNDYIKKTIHKDCKSFELGYTITDVKENIHINWLIKNNHGVNCINNASGFQRFVISMALRMGVFQNKRCDQIFFDEGFTACDKNNLSNVPLFLKGLLRNFKSVIIVSHIDLIQDNVDIISKIKYDTETGSKICC